MDRTLNRNYKIIYADPPWSYNKKIGQGIADDIYKTMDIEDIKKLNISDISDKNSMLFMWVTFPMLKEGLDVINAWGFEYKTLGFSWLKTNKSQKLGQYSFLPTEPYPFFGIGHYTKSNIEVCLIGKRGNVEIKSNKVSSVIIAPLAKHSEKPKIVRKKIVELLGDLPRIELFARQKADGWDCWGNEVESDIDLSPDGNGRTELINTSNASVSCAGT